MARTRRQFSAEFKREAVKLARRPGIAVAQVAKELEVNAGVLRRWMREFETGTWEAEAGKPLKPAQTQELEQLRRELKRVTMERDILKKAVAYFAKDPQ
jgi:transposase